MSSRCGKERKKCLCSWFFLMDSIINPRKLRDWNSCLFTCSENVTTTKWYMFWFKKKLKTKWDKSHLPSAFRNWACLKENLLILPCYNWFQLSIKNIISTVGKISVFFFFTKNIIVFGFALEIRKSSKCSSLFIFNENSLKKHNRYRKYVWHSISDDSNVDTYWWKWSPLWDAIAHIMEKWCTCY